MNFFEIEEVWQLGTRIYFEDQFVSIAPFEEKAYEFFSRYLNMPSLGLTARHFCKRINQVYTQKVGALRELAEKMDSCDEFKGVALQDKPSAIGLPRVLTYTHAKTKIHTEFDGVVFVSEKQISDQSFSIQGAKDFVEKKGAILDDIAQTGSSNAQVWEILAMHSSAHCHWQYVTGKAAFDQAKFKSGIDLNHLILSIDFIDPNYIRITQPTQEASYGERFYFLIGNKEHIRQVIAHESETYHYLNYLESRLRIRRDDILGRRNDLLIAAPLVPWSLRQWLKFKSWRKPIEYWTSLHRSLESVIKHRAYFSCFQQVLDAYKGYEEKGIGFYNLPSPITSINGEKQNPNELSQYPTVAPRPVKIDSNGIKIENFDELLCTYAGYPDKLLKFLASVKNLANDTFELLKSVTVTSGVQAAIVATVISLIALLVAIFGLVLSSILASIG